MKNESIFMQNVSDQFGECEEARNAFRRALNKTGDILLAERHGQEVMDLLEIIYPSLQFAAKLHNLESVPSGLVEFICERHFNLRFGQQAKKKP